jgi:hypothetical protein
MTAFGRSSVTGGGVATVNGSSGVIPAHLNTLRLAGSRGHVTGSMVNVVTDPDVAGNGIGGLKWEGMIGGTGVLGPISGGVASTAVFTQNLMPMHGVVKVCLLSTVCTMNLALPFTAPTTTVNGGVGTGIKGEGIGGTMTLGGYGGIRMSLQFNPWTIKTATLIDQILTPEGDAKTFINRTDKGWAHAPVSTTTSTAQPGGMVQLITPTQIETNLAYGTYDKVRAAGILLIRFIPEPGLLLLLGSGVAGLALLGRSRMRR